MIYSESPNKQSKKSKHYKQPEEEVIVDKSPAVDDCFTFINKKIETSINDTNKWADNQAKFNRIRMRIKKTKTFPFVGCSNLRMPTADTKIKKLKASVVNVIFGIRPVV